MNQFLNNRVIIRVGDITLEKSDTTVNAASFPLISTGTFGYPKHEAAAVTSKAIENFLVQTDFIKQASLVFFPKPPR